MSVTQIGKDMEGRAGGVVGGKILVLYWSKAGIRIEI
jgi:hypothetical protein